MEIHRRDTSWWKDDQLMMMHADKEAYLYIGHTFYNSNEQAFRDLMHYGFSHLAYLNLYDHTTKYITLEEQDEFEKQDYVLRYSVLRPTDEEIRETMYTFDEIAFDWNQTAENAIKYMKEEYDKKQKQKVKTLFR